MDPDAEPAASSTPATPVGTVESASEKKRKKKKKKRKRENEDGEKVKARECVPSHLDTPNQDEDWCQGGIWNLTSQPDTEQSEQKPPLFAATSVATESSQKEPGGDSVKLKKKKKKKMQLVEAMQEITSARSVSKSISETKVTFNQNDAVDLKMLKKKLKKKRKRLKEDVGLWEESRRCLDGQTDQPEAVDAPPKKKSTENGQLIKQVAASVVVWDSQVKDGYKRSQAPAADGDGSGDVQPRAAPVTWDGKKTSGVVEELLKNATDKAYGASVLSWDGEVSAISRDAMEDVRHAKCDTVIDEWDEDFDRGKVKKIKAFKREKWKGGSSIFQKIQDRRNKWSVTPGGKRVFGVRR